MVSIIYFLSYAQVCLMQCGLLMHFSQVVLERPMCIEEYSQCKALGRIVLRDRGMTLAAGIVIGVIECE
jgi:hypothetical protein